MISHPILTWGKQATPGQAPASTVQGSFVRRYGTVRGTLVDPMRSYRETIIEPQQTDTANKQ